MHSHPEHHSSHDITQHLEKPHFSQDAYKVQHVFQYPPGTHYVYSNFTPRGAQHFHFKHFNGRIVLAGPRGFVKKYLREWWHTHFFSRPLEEVLIPYKNMVHSVMGAHVVKVEHIAALHKLGRLPLRVKALPEGALVNLRVPVMTVINTHPDFAWVTNFIETLWSNECWKPITAATIAYEYQRLFQYYAEKTGTPSWFTTFQGHDFSARGMSTTHDSAETGFGHLLSFAGSDTLAAGDYATHCYDADWTKDVIMKAPPATEHAVMCANYALYGEEATYRRLLTEVYPEGMCAIVSDTIDYWNVIGTVIPNLKDVILNRPGNAEGPGKTVLRPDSCPPDMTPFHMLCGYNNWPVFWSDADPKAHVEECFMQAFQSDTSGYHVAMFNEPVTRNYILRDYQTGELTYWKATYKAGEWSNHPDDVEARAAGQMYWPTMDGVVTTEQFEPTVEEKGTYQSLWDIFGGTTNELGYRTLNEHIGAIYGEAISLDMAELILERMATMGFASMNAVFGIGSFTYQYNTRDTFGMAVKATWCEIDGVGYNLQKTPKTDSGVKTSACGLMRVDYVDGNYVVTDGVTLEEEAQGELEIIFEDGELFNRQSLADIRLRLWPTIDWPVSTIEPSSPGSWQEAEEEFKHLA